MSKLLTPAQVSERTGMSYGVVLGFIKAGDLPAVNVARSGTRFRVDPEALAKWLESRQVAA